MKVGYIGLGDIGTPIAERILKQGLDLTLWNRTRGKMTPFVTAGASAAASPSDLARRSEIVALCVDSAEAIEQILFGSEGLVCALDKPRLVVDHSTIHPRQAIGFASRLAHHGIAMIDAPVSGGAAGARSGVLTVMVGGEVEDLNLARPMIEAYARQITHMGAIGAGQATKACNQVINFGTVACIAEALALARAFGLDTRRLPAALAGGLADSNMLREYARGAETGEKAHMTLLVDSLVGLFCADSRRSGASDRLPMLQKDLGIVTELARSNGCAVPVITLVDNLFRISSGLQQIKGQSHE